MSIHVASIVWRTELGGPSIKAVAMKLADCADDDGSNVYPSIRRVAREAEVGERTVQTAIAKLVELQVLELVEKGGRGPGDPNRYKFNMDVLWELRIKTERAWKEEDDRIKGANPAPLKRAKAAASTKKFSDNENSKGAAGSGAKGANSAPLAAKGANSAAKGATDAEKGAAAAPNPSLPVQLDSSLKTRDARVSEFDLNPESEGGARQRRTMTVSKAEGTLYRLDAQIRAEARSLARGWDLDGPEGLVAEFNAANEGRRLTDADAAFLGFCRHRGPHPDAYQLKPSGQPLPSDLVAQSGECAIARNTPAWDLWLRYLDTIDRAAADRMRGAFVVFASHVQPVPGSPVPRIPTPARKGKAA